MRKQVADLVRNYVRSLGEGDLGWICNRLRDRLGGDVAEVVNFMSKSPQIDRWLSETRTANELYDCVDIVQRYAEQDNRLVVSSR